MSNTPPELAWSCAHRREQPVWQAPQPALLLARSAGSMIRVVFLDGSAPLDITAPAADLALDGLRLAAEQADLSHLEVASTDVAEVTLSEGASLFALLADPGTGEVGVIDGAQVLYLLGLALSVQITAGVAHESLTDEEPPSP